MQPSQKPSETSTSASAANHLPATKDELVEVLYRDPELRTMVSEAVKEAEGRVWREERDRTQQREEAERLGRVQGWLDETGVKGLTVGEYQGVRAMNLWTLGIYQNGNFVGNVEASRPCIEISKDDVTLAVLRLKNRLAP